MLMVAAVGRVLLCAISAGAAGLACVTDLRDRIIPNGSCLAIGGAGFLLQMLFGEAGALAFGILFAVLICFVNLALDKVFRCSGRQGVGWGDIKLMAALSLASGKHAAVGCLVSLCAAAVFCLGGILCGRLSFGEGIPLAPFLMPWLLIGLLPFCC